MTPVSPLAVSRTSILKDRSGQTGVEGRSLGDNNHQSPMMEIIASGFSVGNVPWRRCSLLSDIPEKPLAPTPKSKARDNDDLDDCYQIGASDGSAENNGNVNAASPVKRSPGSPCDGSSLEDTFSRLAIDNCPWRMCCQRPDIDLLPTYPPTPHGALESDDEDLYNLSQRYNSSNDSDVIDELVTRGPVPSSQLEQARNHPYPNRCIRPLIQNGGSYSVNEVVAQGETLLPVLSSSSSLPSDMAVPKIQQILAGGKIVTKEGPVEPAVENSGHATEPCLNISKMAHILSKAPNRSTAPVLGFHSDLEDCLQSGSPQTDHCCDFLPSIIGSPEEGSEMEAIVTAGLCVVSPCTTQTLCPEADCNQLLRLAGIELEGQQITKNPNDRTDSDEVVGLLRLYELDDLVFTKQVYDAAKLFDSINESAPFSTSCTYPGPAAPDKDCHRRVSSGVLRQAVQQNGMQQPFYPAINSSRAQESPQAIIAHERAPPDASRSANVVQMQKCLNASYASAPPESSKMSSVKTLPELTTAAVCSKYEKIMMEFKQIRPSPHTAATDTERREAVSSISEGVLAPSTTEFLSASGALHKTSSESMEKSSMSTMNTSKSDLKNLHIAVANDNLDLPLVVIDRNGNHGDCIDVKDDNWQTPLFSAVNTKNVELTKHLLCGGMDPNPSDKDGNTPLHLLAMRGPEFLEVGNLLCQARNVLLNKTNVQGLTALHIAVRKHSQSLDMIPFIKMLLSHGAGLSFWEPRSRRTPLHMAVQRGHPELVTALCRSCNCADMAEAINLSSTKGTALHYAAMLNKLSEEVQSEIVKTLLWFGGSPSVRCKDIGNLFPKDLVANGRKTVKALLKVNRK